jgi:plasmid stabilization system protein ParE
VPDYHLHPAADEDLVCIARWIARDNQDAARRFLDQAFAEFDFIADWPEASPLARFKSRRLARIRVRPVSPPFQNYLVFYVWQAGETRIVRVLHGATNCRDDSGALFG